MTYFKVKDKIAKITAPPGTPLPVIINRIKEVLDDNTITIDDVGHCEAPDYIAYLEQEVETAENRLKLKVNEVIARDGIIKNLQSRVSDLEYDLQHDNIQTSTAQTNGIYYTQ